jgi:hypothetical protein
MIERTDKTKFCCKSIAIIKPSLILILEFLNLPIYQKCLRSRGVKSNQLSRGTGLFYE